ncbi:MAG: hypothetical protein KBG42_09755 [Lachnospiraceae bacterium]|nr:hypothetical protein [Lachnospiraceae bacterium]
MWSVLYNSFVRKNSDIQYEYERYVMEHMDEHYSHRLKQWKLLLDLNVHYRIKKHTERMIFKEITVEPQHFSVVDEIANGTLYPGLDVYNRIKSESDEKIFLCPYAGTGDVYMASMYLQNYVSDKGIKSYVLAVIGQGNIKVAKLFNISKIVSVSQIEADSLIRLTMFLGDSCNDIEVLHHDAPQVHFGILENFRNINGFHFTDLFVNAVFGHSPDVCSQKPSFSYDNDEIESLFDKYKLKKGKTVVLSPYANTLSLLPKWIWEDLTDDLIDKGYSVVTNCGCPGEIPVRGTIPVFFDYSISVPFIEKCGYFVGIRSGLCDVISSARARKIIVYQPYVFWGEGTPYDYFSLNRIGFCSDALELEYEGVEFLDLVKQIENRIFADESAAKGFCDLLDA